LPLIVRSCGGATAVRDKNESAAQEIRRLFAELGEVYAHAEEATSSTAYISGGITGRMGEERSKASSIISRIRQLQGL
jgi:hypothetical protein